MLEGVEGGLEGRRTQQLRVVRDFESLSDNPK